MAINSRITMTEETIIKFIKQEIRKLSPDSSDLTSTTDIVTDIRLDSVAVMNLVFELEEEFDISIPLNSLTEVRTIQDLATLIEKEKNQD
jgi:acyl carrier protein